MKVTPASHTTVVWLLLLLGGDIQSRYGSIAVQAFAPAANLATRSKCGYPSRLFSKGEGDETPRKDDCNKSTIYNISRSDRRGTIMTLLGTAVSFAAGDVVFNTAIKATGAAGTAVVATGGGLYERVIAFGNKYRGAAIASEELTTWIAAQNVAATPEIRAWLAGQRRLQMVRKTTVAATAAVTRAKTTKRAAAAAGGGILEEGILAAAATAVARVISASSKRDDTAGTAATTDDEPAPTTLEIARVSKDEDGESFPALPSKADDLPELEDPLSAPGKKVQD